MQRLLGYAFALVFPTLVIPSAQNSDHLVNVNRPTAFALGSSRFDISPIWKGLFCKPKDRKICILEEARFQESETRETLGDGKSVRVWTYAEKTGYLPFAFMKDLQSSPRTVDSVISERIEVSSESISLKWHSETVRIRREKLGLLITKTGPPQIEQSFTLYRDPTNSCTEGDYDSTRFWTLVDWVGDLDRDQKPDFVIMASAYKSCGVTILDGPEQGDPAHFLILSGRASPGQIGRLFVPGDRRQR